MQRQPGIHGITRVVVDGEQKLELAAIGSVLLLLRCWNRRFVAAEIAGEGSAGDIYAQAQYQLHTGRILVCATGLAAAML